MQDVVFFIYFCNFLEKACIQCTYGIKRIQLVLKYSELYAYWIFLLSKCGKFIKNKFAVRDISLTKYIAINLFHIYNIFFRHIEKYDKSKLSLSDLLSEISLICYLYN